MARLECGRGWGAVEDPETGDDITLNVDGVEPDVAMRVADEYGQVTATLTDDEKVEADSDDSIDEDAEDAEDAEDVVDLAEVHGEKDVDDQEDDAEDGDGPVCGVNDCSRPVDEPDETCWQHGED